MMLRKVALITLALSLIPVIAFAVSSTQLAVEQQKLYNRLDAGDPLRAVVALRLADLCFDASTEVEKGVKFGDEQVAQMEAYRVKAIGLYEGSLSGFKGKFAKPDPSTQLRVKFQLARLYNDGGQFAKADELWTELAAQKSEPRLQRESALKRAEKLELSTTSVTDLNKAKDYYNVALPTCGTDSLCSYIHYRRGWVNYRIGNADTAIADLLKALEITDSSSVSEIIKDVVLFIPHTTWTVEKGIELIEKFAKQICNGRESSRGTAF